MVLLHRECDDELSPEEVQALMEINQKLVEINQQLKRMEASASQLTTTMAMSHEDFERRMNNLEKKFGYTWSSQPTPMKPPPTSDPVQPFIYPSKQDELSVDVVMSTDECETKLVTNLEEDENTMEKPVMELSSSIHLKPTGTRQVSEALNLEVTLSDSVVVEYGCATSSHVSNRTLSLCLPSVCENANKELLIICNTSLNFDRHQGLDVIENAKVEVFGLAKPPPLPPDIVTNGEDELNINLMMMLMRELDSSFYLQTQPVNQDEALKLESIPMEFSAYLDGSWKIFQNFRTFLRWAYVKSVWVWFDQPPSWSPDVVRFLSLYEELFIKSMESELRCLEVVYAAMMIAEYTRRKLADMKENKIYMSYLRASNVMSFSAMGLLEVSAIGHNHRVICSTKRKTSKQSSLSLFPMCFGMRYLVLQTELLLRLLFVNFTLPRVTNYHAKRLRIVLRDMSSFPMLLSDTILLDDGIVLLIFDANEASNCTLCIGRPTNRDIIYFGGMWKVGRKEITYIPETSGVMIVFKLSCQGCSWWTVKVGCITCEFHKSWCDEMCACGRWEAGGFWLTTGDVIDGLMIVWVRHVKKVSFVYGVIIKMTLYFMLTIRIRLLKVGRNIICCHSTSNILRGSIGLVFITKGKKMMCKFSLNLAPAREVSKFIIFKIGEASIEAIVESYGFCAICLEQIHIQENALVKGSEHALTFILQGALYMENAARP